MKNKDYLVQIGDVLGVEVRLKEIDSGYRIFYNKLKHRAEVHNVNQVGDSFCLVIPYDQVDARVISLVRKTRIENSCKLIEQIEEENKKIERDEKLRKRELLKEMINSDRPDRQLE